MRPVQDCTPVYARTDEGAPVPQKPDPDTDEEHISDEALDKTRRMRATAAPAGYGPPARIKRRGLSFEIVNRTPWEPANRAHDRNLPEKVQQPETTIREPRSAGHDELGDDSG